MIRCEICNGLIFELVYCIDPTVTRNFKMHPYTDKTLFFCGAKHSQEWHTAYYNTPPNKGK